MAVYSKKTNLNKNNDPYQSKSFQLKQSGKKWNWKVNQTKQP